MIMIFICIRRDFEPLYFIYPYICLYYIPLYILNIFFLAIIVCLYFYHRRPHRPCQSVYRAVPSSPHDHGHGCLRVWCVEGWDCKCHRAVPPPHLIMVTHHASVDANLPPPEFIKTFWKWCQIQLLRLSPRTLRSSDWREYFGPEKSQREFISPGRWVTVSQWCNQTECRGWECEWRGVTTRVTLQRH